MNNHQGDSNLKKEVPELHLAKVDSSSLRVFSFRGLVEVVANGGSLLSLLGMLGCLLVSLRLPVALFGPLPPVLVCIYIFCQFLKANVSGDPKLVKIMLLVAGLLIGTMICLLCLVMNAFSNTERTLFFEKIFKWIEE